MISSDEEEDFSEPCSAPRPPAGPRYQRARFQDHLRNSGTQANFRYTMSEEDLVELGRRIQGLKKSGSGLIVVIGMVRTRSNLERDTIPEYVVTAGLFSTGALAVRVWNQDIQMEKLPPWGKKNRRVMDREDFRGLGYQFSPFSSMSNEKLIGYLQGIRIGRSLDSS